MPITWTDRRTLHAIATLMVCLIVSTANAERRVTVETIEEEMVGQLVELDSDQRIALAGDKEVQLQPQQVLAIRFEQPTFSLATTTEPSGQVELTDGSTLPYRSWRIEEDRLLLMLGDDSRAEVSISSVVSWQLERPIDPTGRSPLPVPTADVLLVKRRGNEGLTPVEGVISGLSEGGVQFALGDAADAEPIVVGWNRLGGIRFFRETSQLKQSRPLAITLRGEGRLIAERLQLDDDQLLWESSLGTGRLAIDEVEAIDLAPGRVTAVATLSILDHTWKPYFGEADDESGYTLNTSLTGAPLSLRRPDHRASERWPDVALTSTYASGIALKSRGELRFALPERLTRLKGLIGLDPATARVGSAEVAILAGNRTIWSGTIDGETHPVEVNAPIDGERTLTLRVDYGDNFDSGDYVHFANLRVIE